MTQCNLCMWNSMKRARPGLTLRSSKEFPGWVAVYDPQQEKEITWFMTMPTQCAC